MKFIIASTLSLLSLPAFAAVFESGGIYYESIAESPATCIVTAPSANNPLYSGEISIPAKVDYGNQTYSVTGIKAYAFSRSGVTSVTLPEGMTEIGRNAFSSCVEMTQISLPSTVNEIEEQTFYKCATLKTISLKSVTAIHKGAFGNCESLETLELSANLQEIGESAFSDCYSLRAAQLPQSVTKIGSGAYSGCISLSEVTLPEKSKEIPDFLFRGCISITEVSLPDNLETIGNYSFYGCKNLKELNLPSSLTEIESNAFGSCMSLTKIDFNQTELYINELAFSNCQGLQTVDLKGVIEVGEDAFSNNSALKRILIRETVREIEGRAFRNCPEIKEVLVYNEIPPFLANTSFSEENYQEATLTVPYGKKLLYSQTPPWSYFVNITEMSGVEQISDEVAVAYSLNGRMLKVEGAPGLLEVFSISGQSIHRDVMTADAKTFELPSAGLYILTLNGNPIKILAR